MHYDIKTMSSPQVIHLIRKRAILPTPSSLFKASVCALILWALLADLHCRRCHALVPPPSKRCSASSHSHHDASTRIPPSVFDTRSNNHQGNWNGASTRRKATLKNTNNTNNHNNNASDTIPRGGHNPPQPTAPLPPHKQILLSLQRGYRQRLAADPSFLIKSILEIIVAASTQFAAEVSRRGWDRMAIEGDFVFSGVLTAVFGKYFSMWRVAKTVQLDDDVENENEQENETRKKHLHQQHQQHPSTWRDKVPNNAFQATLLDGRTKPTLPSRLLAFLLPMPQLFRAGVISSTVGYGLTYLLTVLRAILMERGIIPFYDVRTEPVSVPLAAIYTGMFMAVVSNVRYQILQGVVEPYLIDGGFDKLERGLDSLEGRLKRMQGLGVLSRLLRALNGIEFWRKCKGIVIVLVRWGNGLLGSWIAIGGMRACGLQKMKG